MNVIMSSTFRQNNIPVDRYETILWQWITASHFWHTKKDRYQGQFSPLNYTKIVLIVLHLFMHVTLGRGKCQ